MGGGGGGLSLENEKKKKKIFACVTYSIKRALGISNFHVAVVQQRLRNVQKSVMHVQSCCFANTNLLLFCLGRRRCLRWLGN